MTSAGTVAGTTGPSLPGHGSTTIVLVAAIASLIWYVFVAVVGTLGYTQIWRHYSTPQAPASISTSTSTSTSSSISLSPQDDLPHVTVIRPIKGLEPRLYDCLASTFHQNYPTHKLHIRLCLSDRNDPAIPVVKQLLQEFPSHPAQLFLEEEDKVLKTKVGELGPNPKIRNMSRAYREACGDIVWIVDCNVWVAKGVCGRMVAKLDGRGGKQKYKLVHQLPLVVDIVGTTAEDESHDLLNRNMHSETQIRTTSSASASFQSSFERNAVSIGGGRIEEAFMSSSHPKFYTAINTIAVAPCIVGKSTMFRRSHLNSLTENAGLDYFSETICEDHLIGDLLWKKKVPVEYRGEKFGKHALCCGDLAVQPMANMSIQEYWSRRVRWLRVRKFTVTLATFVEPGTESFLCSVYGAFAVTMLPLFRDTFGLPPTWTAFAVFWLLSVSIWCLVDWTLYRKLHSGASFEVDEDTPFFARPPQGRTKRRFVEWLPAWLGREAFALPIWIWAFWGGSQVEWRGKKFWVGMDMKVHEITTTCPQSSSQAAMDTPVVSKARKD